MQMALLVRIMRTFCFPDIKGYLLCLDAIPISDELGMIMAGVAWESVESVNCMSLKGSVWELK